MRIFLLLGLCVLLSPAFSQSLPLDPAVRTGKLPNGLTYFVRRNTEPAGRTVLYLVNKVGSILEADDQRGLAHFMEHMSFNGTTHFPKNELVDYLQKAGIRFGADLNAYTSFDETVYQLPIPSDKPGVLAGGIQILRDWAASATLDPVEIDKERGVVLEEKRLGKGASERMSRKYWPLVLNHSRYAERIPIGVDTVLNHFRPEAIRRFYHDWYRPDLQAVIVVGDIDADSVVRAIQSTFSDLRNPPGERARPVYTVPLTGRNQFITVTDKEMTGTAIEVIIKHKGLPFHTAADYRAYIVRGLFNQMLAGRYAELSRVANPPYLQGGASIQSFMGGLDSYDASVAVRPRALDTGFKALWRETERVKRFGFTASELERAKTSYLNGMKAALQEMDKTPSESFVKEYQEYFLKGVPAPGLAAENVLVQKDMPGVSLAEVNALATQYVTDTNRDILVLAPENTPLPDERTVLSWLQAVRAEDLKPYTDQVSTQSLLATPPVAGHVVSETADTSLHITTLTLSNGLRVVLKPTHFKNDEILFSAAAPGGTSVYGDAAFQSAAAAAGIIVSGGVGNYDATQLQKYLSGKQARVNIAITDRGQGFGGAATPEDLPTALELVYAYFTEPRKDTAVFQSIIERSRAAMANRANDPGSVFSDTANALLHGNNVRMTGPSLAKLAQINLDTAYRIYRERFSDASAFTFTFVGNFDTATIRPLLERYLGGLPSTHAGEQPVDRGDRTPPGKITKIVYKGSEPKASVYLIFSGPFDYTLEDRVRLDALKEALQIRLTQRLREEESGVYTPSASASISKLPLPRYSFTVSFTCAPENADKLVASALDEIATLRASGPPAENVEKWKAEERVSTQTQQQTNGWWLAYLGGQMENRDDLHQVYLYPAAVDAVTPEALRQTANRYLSGDNLIRLELMPEK